MTTPPVPPPSDFVPYINNTFFDLQPGTTFTSEDSDGGIGTFVVTRQTKVIDGVTCVVVQDTTTVDGQPEEKTFDYFAQDKAGNVWYFGEFATQYDNGHVVGHDGSWQAGVDGAQPGVAMEASPQVGDMYDQEDAPGVAEDRGQVVAAPASFTVPYGTFVDLLETKDFSAIEPGSEHKIYAAGVGFIHAIDDPPTDPIVEEQLKSIRVDGTYHGDMLYGYAGGDEVNGNGGKDHLDGWLGADTIKGGSGNDLIEGGGKLRFDGGDDHAADYLYGGSGKDTVLVGAGDHGFGGSGNDLMHLFDNTGFGAIDGGSQDCRNVGRSAGDVLQFDGSLDLTSPGLGERITGIETLSMHDGKGNDSLALSAQDVLDLGSGTFDPRLGPHDGFDKGDAVRVDGDNGDKLSLSGNWTAIDPSNGPDGFDVYACHAPAGNGNVYALVQEDIVVTITATT